MGKLIAKVHQTFAGREIVPGEEIEADEREERVLLAIGRARKAADDAQTPTVAAEPAKKRTYQRRDLTAEK